jgi:CBS domain-containing protein
MSTVETILKDKPRKVLTTTAGASVLDAARIMNDHHIGSLVVVDDCMIDKIVGIITERDIMTKVVAGRRNPEHTTVAEAMTDRVLTCTPATGAEELRHVMRAKRIRHLPVVDEHGRLLGMISIGDLNQAEVKVLAETVMYLEQYSVRM